MHPSPDLTIDLRSSLQRRLRVWAWVVLGVLGIAGAGAAVLDANRSATPFPVPVYDIEATSGDHTASLLNLGLGQPGAPQEPVPVDVDGDLLPDITVAVNLVNAEGLLNNPPDSGEVTAPNVEITRLETATLLAQESPPVRVNVVFTVTDLEGEEPDTVMRFGYETGEGGSIPQEFKALVGGLDRFFNPIEAVVDTTGGPLGLDPGVQDLGLAPASSSYEGPLTVVAGVESGDTRTDVDLEYSPFPEAVRTTFGWDETGQHLTYAHDRHDEIDLDADVDLVTGDRTIAFDAAIDRLPRSMAIDLFQDGTRGAIDYQARSDERLPDVRADLRLEEPGSPPLNAAVDVEDLPRQMHAGWDTATPEAEFTGSGTAVGAIEARIATFDGEPTVVDEFVPDEQQHVTVDFAPGGAEGDEVLVGARLERIRSVSLRQDGEGIEAELSTDGGELPLQLHGDLDLRQSGAPHLTATATIAPLPDDVGLSVQPAGGGASEQPFRVTYDVSSPVDVDTNLELVEAGAAGDDCGDGGTLCADVAARHLPSHLQARVVKVSAFENRIEVDADGSLGATKPDLDADVVIGQDDGAPLVADASIEGLARHLRIRTIQGADETLETFEFHTCDRVFAADPTDDVCEPGSEDEIGLVDFAIANFFERPEGLPAPSAVAPNHATVTGRGTTIDGEDVVRFEATGRIESIEKVQYVKGADVLGIATTNGDGKDLEIDVDLAGIDFQGDDPGNGRVDVGANSVVSPLPDDITFCFADVGRELSGPTHPVTAPCQDTDPFGDGASPPEGPMVAAYRANQDFDLDFSVDLHIEGQDATTVADDRDLEAALTLDNVPNDATAVVQPAGNGRPMRGLVTAPAAAERFDVDLRAEHTTGGVDCDDPQPTSLGAVAVACANVQIDDLPEAASFVVDATDPENLQFIAHACDLDVTGTGDCRPGTASEIGALAVDGRVWLGEPRGVGHHEPTEDQYVVGRADVVDADNLELRATMRLEEIRSVEFQQTADGLEASTDLGTGVKPLEVHGEADLRSAALDDGYRLVGDVLVDPLPRTLSFEQTAPGADQDVEPMEIAFDTNEADTIDDVVDVDAAFELKEPEAAADDLCGAAHTACAAVALDRLPRDLDLQIAETEATDGEDLTSQLLAEVTTTQHAVQSGAEHKTDLTVEATLGPDTFGLNAGTPLVDGKPLAAHLELNALPTVVHARMTDRTVDDGTTTSTQLETVDVHTCAPDDPGLAGGGTCDAGDELGEVVVNLRNFLKRPGNVPPPDPDTPVYVTLTGRGELFETEARLDSIRDVAYANHGDELGATVGIGSGEDFSVVADVKDFAIASLGVGDLQVSPAVLDLDAEAVIRDLPTFASFCMRNGGLDTEDVVARGGLLSPCEDPDPFDDEEPLTHTPLTVAFRASNDITVETEAQLVVSGQAAGSSITPRTIRGILDVADIPAELTTHFLMPGDDGNGPEGPMRLLYDTTSSDAEQMDIHFEALMAVGDAVCEDPRTTADSICAQGDIDNLPSRAEVFLDPTVAADNFEVRTPGQDSDLELTNLLFASVKPTDDPDDADVMVIEGEILGLPDTVTGSLSFPDDEDDPPSVRLEANPPLGAVNGTFRNFIAPDPVPDGAPGQRAGLPEPTQTFSVFQRGDALKADVSITDLRGGGYETLRGQNGEALSTSVMSVDFGGDQTVRTYADVMPEQGERTIGDVTIENLPAGIDVCFRGEKDDDEGDALVDNFCDRADPAATAFQFRGDAIEEEDGASVHAFLRHTSAGGRDLPGGLPSGQDILSGDVSVVDIPPVVQGTYLASDDGDKRLDVGGFELDETTSRSIGEIDFALATFDLPGHGYEDPPFEPRIVDGGPFPVPTSDRQFASFGVDETTGDLEAVGRIGLADDTRPSSRLQHLLLTPDPCPIPDDEPEDYPHFPLDETDYTCLRVELEQTQAAPDPLDLHAEIVGDDDVLRLRDAGLTDLPKWFQLTMAETATLEDDGSFRRRCGFHAKSPREDLKEEPGTSDCMAPRLRLDQPAESTFFGVAEFGTADGLADLRAVQPREDLADFDESPNAARPDFWTGWGSDPAGVRAKIIIPRVPGIDELPDVSLDDLGAARVGMRLPVPASFTLDQVQKWSSSNRDTQQEYWDATDARFRFVVRDADGEPVDSLGELTALLHSAEDGTQILLSDPRLAVDVDPDELPEDPPDEGDDRPDPEDRPGSPVQADTDGYVRGVTIPGEVGIDFYKRDHKGDGSSLLQIDGQVSDNLHLGARVLGGAGFKIGRGEVQVHDLPGRQPDDAPGDLSFRYRIHQLAGGSAPTDGGGDEPEENETCTWYYCMQHTVNFEEAFVSVDFDPDDSGSPARRVDAVLNTRNGRQGVEIQAFDQPVGDGPAGVDAHARVDVDPINVSMRAGIPLLGSATFMLRSDLEAGFSLNEVSQMGLRHRLGHVNLESTGSTTIGPVLYNIHHMQGRAVVLLAKLFGVDFLPPSPPPLALVYRSCSPPFGPIGLWGLNATDETRDFLISPIDDPRVIYSGLLGGPLQFIDSFIAPFFCLTDVSEDAIPLVTSSIPGDPVGESADGEPRAVGHPVPDAPVAVAEPASVDVDPQPDDFTLPAGETLALCGRQSFGDLTVDGTLEVAMAASDADSVTDDDIPAEESTRQDCPEGETGSLQIVADHVTVGPSGSIDGSERITTTAPSGATGVSGAGHGGEGGQGATGDPGSAHGDTDLTVDTEPGARGGGSQAGDGGAVIVINAQQLTNGGTITVRGGDGAARTAGECDQFEEDGEPTSSNSGDPGFGGGSGGGLVMAVIAIENNGTIDVRGGAGGDGRDGGGGGGAGGIAKIISPLYSGSDVRVEGGAGGHNLCEDEDENPAPAGEPGGDGVSVTEHGPQSQAQPPGGFWYPGEVDVPFSAAAEGGADRGLQVALCSSRVAPSAVADAGEGTTLDDLFEDEMPLLSPAPGRPCGSDSFFGATHPPKDTFGDPVDRVVFDPPTETTMEASGLVNGYEGFWTVAATPLLSGTDCLNDQDAAFCTFEANPTSPDTILGIDTVDPDLDIDVTSPVDVPDKDFATNGDVVTVDIDAADDLAGVIEKEGDIEVECTGHVVGGVSCREGPNQIGITPDDGRKTINVTATDEAGNDTAETLTGLRDTAPPDGSAQLTSGEQGSEGWYTSPPALTLTDFDDGKGVGAGDAPWLYRFDGGSWRTCDAAPSCTIPSTALVDLGVGAHTVEVRAQDALGELAPTSEDSPNRSEPIAVLELHVDDEPPETALRTVPTSPDTPDGWFTQQPWIVLSAIDQVGGSDVPATGANGAGPQYRVDGGPWQEYSGPFRLSTGVTTQLCVRSVDVAGNVEPVDDASCEGPFRVDDAAPAGDISFDDDASPTPTGDNGWFDTVPDVELTSFTDDQGAPLAGGQFRYRVDNSPYVDCSDPCTVDPSLLTTGRHLVHWTAVDRLGNQRADDTYALDVDTAAPTTRVLVTPEPPGRGLNGWHWERPWVVLDAIDQPDGSGVADTAYTIDGGPAKPYTGPFQVADGEHVVCVVSSDVAGNHEAEHCVELQVDTADPTTAASAPTSTGGDGWHLEPITTTVTSTDATSGVDLAFDPSTADLCTAGAQDQDPTAPSGTCLSIDGGPFVPWEGEPLDLDEGVHRLRAFSQDVSGRRSAMLEERYRIDGTAPVTNVRLVPARGNDDGWYRRVPTMVLRAGDGDPVATSSVEEIEYRIDTGPWTTYERPVPLTDGVLDVDTRVRDRAGNVRADLDAGTFPIDVTPPTIVPRDPSPLVWSRLLGPDEVDLRWSVTEDLSETVRVGVIVHDATGNVVRRLDGGVHQVKPGTTYHGSTTWDGQNQTLTGLVPLGVYYYRVVAVDEAGNVAHSRESRPMTIRLL